MRVCERLCQLSGSPEGDLKVGREEVVMFNAACVASLSPATKPRKCLDEFLCLTQRWLKSLDKKVLIYLVGERQSIIAFHAQSTVEWLKCARRMKGDTVFEEDGLNFLTIATFPFAELLYENGPLAEVRLHV